MIYQTFLSGGSAPATMPAQHPQSLISTPKRLDLCND
jgi:hypothetical protein